MELLIFLIKVSTLDENKFISSLRTICLCTKLNYFHSYDWLQDRRVVIKQKDSMCSVIDHSMVSWSQKNPIPGKNIMTKPLFVIYYYLLTSSVFYYWTDARQYGFCYLLNRNVENEVLETFGSACRFTVWVKSICNIAHALVLSKSTAFLGEWFPQLFRVIPNFP